MIPWLDVVAVPRSSNRGAVTRTCSGIASAATGGASGVAGGVWARAGTAKPRAAEHKNRPRRFATDLRLHADLRKWLPPASCRLTLLRKPRRLPSRWQRDSEVCYGASRDLDQSDGVA